MRTADILPAREDEGAIGTIADQDSTDTGLARAIRPLTKAHPRTSGIVPLVDGRDAFAARSLLTDAAERTLDVQYYIWRKDMSGILMLQRLCRAAERGVRVRLLLDDINTKGLDPLLAELDAHPNIEVRIFNPFRHRNWRILDATNFARLNRRMHNKSFTVDNQATIIGGRNIGDEYFDAGQSMLFVDLDVLAIGPVVNDVTQDFDRYWNSVSARPVSRFLPRGAAVSLDRLAAMIADSAEAVAYTKKLADTQFVRQLLAGELEFEWAKTIMVSDDPAKVLDRASERTFVWRRLKELFGDPKTSFELVSPYFVPGPSGVEYFAKLAKSGVSIRVLTNALESTDVAAVHAGYARKRRALLPHISIFEMKRSGPRPPKGRAIGGSSARSSLHAKTFSMDGTRVFIGSFNFDPRSARLNTENGFVIDSPAIAKGISKAFAEGIRHGAYELKLERGRVRWIETKDGQEIVHVTEPGTSFWLRARVRILALLPLEWML